MRNGLSNLWALFLPPWLVQWCWICALAIVLLAPVLVRADSPDGLAAHPDLRMTLWARQALLADPQLAPLNLGIKVEKRIAYLWGGVPSKALRLRAEQILQRLPDILEVRSALHLEEMDEPDRGYLPPASSGVPAVPPPTAELARPLNIWVARPAPAAMSTSLLPQKEALRLQPAVSPLRPMEEDDSALLPSILLPDPGMPAPGVRLTPTITELQSTIERLLRQERYRLLQADLRERRVYLSGQVQRWDDLHGLARVLARLPGVEGVVVGQVSLVGRRGQ